MSNLSSKIDTSVQKLKDEIGNEGLQRKKEHDAPETRIEAKIESGKRRRVQDQLTVMKDEMKNHQDGK